MTELNQDSFDARWFNCLYGGKLPGKVRKKTASDIVFIQPLISLTLLDGEKVDEFVAFRSNYDEEDYVIFEWKNVGRREFNQKKGRFDNPLAINVESISQEEAISLATVIERRIVESRIEELKQEIDLEKKRLEQQALALQNQSDSLYISRQELDQRQKDLAREKEELNKRAEELAPYALAVPIAKPELKIIEDELPENLGNIWREQLLSRELQVSKEIANSFLICLFSGFYSGSIVLLNGSVGVGKTSIVKKSAKILGGSCAIIPVRPAWLEPADLLGFFDPIHEVFRPTGFLSALKDAENKDNLHLICLDELNLAKIENYASDLLSKLEYSHKSRKSDKLDETQDDNSLLLFSGDIETELWQEVEYLKKQQFLESHQKARQQRLKFLEKWRSHQPVPQNIVLLGTLNSDETTYDLSPKVIDRAYTITYPIADFSSERNLAQKALTRPITVSTSKLRKILDKLYDANFNLLKEGKLDGWEHIKDWNEDYMSSFPYLGIALGYRTRADYAVFHSVGIWLGLGEEEIRGHFLFAKILPRVFFLKNDQTTKRFQECLEELKQNYKDYDPANILDRLEHQLKDERRQTVRYWG
jgi:hypothetical protein